MSLYRFGMQDLSQAAGRKARQIRQLIQRQIIDTFLPDLTARILGREDEFGQHENLTALQAHPQGFVGRGIDGSQTQAIVVYVGARGDTPVAIATLDPQARIVIENAGLESDESIQYNTTNMVKLTSDNQILIGSQTGTHKELAFKSDADSLNARITSLEANFNDHIHPETSVNTGPPTVPSSTSATIEGTVITKAE